MNDIWEFEKENLLYSNLETLTSIEMKDKIKTLKFIHLAICGGTILIYLVLGNISLETLNIPSMDSSSNYFLAVPLVAFVLGNFLFKSQLKQVDKTMSLEDNFGIYQTASIIRLAILEAAAFIILLMAPEYLLFGIFVIIYMMFLIPTETRMKTDLQYLD